MNNHKPNAFKPFKPLLRASQFPRFRNRGYQSQKYSRKQEGTNLQGYRVCFFLILNIYYLCDLSVAEFFFSPMVSCFHLLLHEALPCMQAPAPRYICIIQHHLKWWNLFVFLLQNYCFGTFCILGHLAGEGKVKFWRLLFFFLPDYSGSRAAWGGKNSAGLLQMIGVSGAGRACMPSSRADHATPVVGQLKEGESCSLSQEGEARSPK